MFKQTKRALLVSVLMLVICFGMLIGTTYAWFTDSVSSSGNVIQAGNLDVDMQWAKGTEDPAAAVWNEAEVPMFTNNNWEPGYTEARHIKISNEGTLALKYKVIITTEKEVSKLAEVIDVYYMDSAKQVVSQAALTEENKLGTLKEVLAALGKTGEGELLAGKADTITLVLKMQEDAGNEYKGLSLAGEFTIKVVATQLNFESDSFGSDYDVVTMVTNSDELKSAIEVGGDIIVMNDITVDVNAPITVAAGKKVNLDLNGKTIASVSTVSDKNSETFLVKGELNVINGTMTYLHAGNDMQWNKMTTIFDITAGGKVVLENVNASNLGGTSMAFVAHLNNWGTASLEINNCSLFSTYCAVRVFNSGPDMNNVTITNSKLVGSLAVWVHNYTSVDFGGKLYSGSSATYDVEKVKARLNFNFLVENPQVGLEANDASNLNAEANNTMVGRILFGFTDGEKYYYTSESLVATSNETLDTAIKEGAKTIYLGEGNYIIPNSAKGKTLKIVGTGKTVVATKSDGSYEGCNYSLDGSTVVFEGITINTTSTTYVGYARLNATYNNCTINGTYTLYGNSEFNNCTFNVSGDVYNIWTWGAPTATFNNCTFNSDGKALLLYGRANTKLTINDCTFNDKGGLKDLKAAIEIGNDYNTTYELIVNNTKVNGYEINDKGINTETTLWGNKNSMGKDKLNVVVDGVDVY